MVRPMSLGRRDDFPAAFLPPVPLSLAPRSTGVRRPRHAARRKCRCRVGRPRVRCVAGEDPPDDDARPAADSKADTWFPSLPVWFKSKESAAQTQTPPEIDERVEEEEEVHVEPHVNLGAEVVGDDEEGKPRMPFRWPWQKEAGAENNGISSEARADDVQVEVRKVPTVKKVSHSDSKPGGSFTKVSKNGQVEPASAVRDDDPASWQERLDKIMRIIAPNIKRDQSDASVSDEETSGRAAGNGIHMNGDPPQQSSPPHADSVSELYSPPIDPSEEGREPFSSQGRRPKWPKMPWSRDKEEEKSPSIKEEQVTIVSENKSRAGPRISKISVVKKDSEKDHPPEIAVTQDRQRDSETTVLDVVDFTDSRETKQEEERALPEDQPGDGEKEQTKALPSGTGEQLRIAPIDVVSIPQRDVAAIRLIFGSETFFATETLSPPGGLIFRGNLRGEPKATLAKLEERLAARLGDKYTLCLAEGEQDLRPVVVVVPTARDKRPATPRQRILALIIALFTVTTCLTRGLYAALYKPIVQAFYPLTGASRIQEMFVAPSGIALTTSVAIGLVIIVSQIVQRIVASHHGTRIALPYFIPSVQLGSFGAVVQLASPTPSRAALFDIALAGAATLVVLSMAFLLVGLRLSTIFPTVVPVPISTVSSSVVIGFLTQQIPQGQILVDYGRSLIGLHPLAIIGANCLTIAALNLLPIRQLDGGRIISALYGRRTAVVTSRVTVLFLLLASTKSPYFVVFLAAVTFGPWSLDRPAKNELTEPNGLRTVIGYLFMLLMIGVLLPFPASRFFGTL